MQILEFNSRGMVPERALSLYLRLITLDTRTVLGNEF
jgi:hypothetical protein